MPEPSNLDSPAPGNEVLGARAGNATPPEATPADLEEIRRAQGRLADRLQLVDSQVADLQEDQVHAKNPFKDVSTLIAAFAFLFSLGTTVFSYQQAKQTRIHDSRAKLRSLIQRLSALPKENIETLQTYQNNPAALGQISGLLQEENALLAKQAAEVMASIPDQITSSEYILVANALMNSNLVDKASELYERAETVVKDANDGVSILRSRAALYFLQGNFKAGRDTYDRALGIFKSQPSRNRWYEETTHAQTEMLWAQTEMGQKQCPEAKTHIASARGHIAPFLVQGLPNPLDLQITQTENYLRSLCP